MDDLVKQALLKWPNVPGCYDWLALDQRGQWRIGHDRQTFTHRPTIAFINRNYLSDEHGRWFFQNGPQRVYVKLDYTPIVWRLMKSEDQQQCSLMSHTGQVVHHIDSIWLDENARLLIEAEQMVGVLHDHDMALVIEYLCNEKGQLLTEVQADEAVASAIADATLKLYIHWPLHSGVMTIATITSAQVAEQFGFDPHPSAE